MFWAVTRVRRKISTFNVRTNDGGGLSGRGGEVMEGLLSRRQKITESLNGGREWGERRQKNATYGPSWRLDKKDGPQKGTW